jgi:hypothetical protein
MQCRRVSGDFSNLADCIFSLSAAIIASRFLPVLRHAIYSNARWNKYRFHHSRSPHFVARAVFDQVAGAHSVCREANGIQSHEDLYVPLATAAGLPDIKGKMLTRYTMNGVNYTVHLDGYNNLDSWTGKTETSARREIYYYDETDLLAMRVDGWRMHIGVKRNGLWWDQKYYPSVPYVFNLLMDPEEKMDPQSDEWGYIGRKFFAQLYLENALSEP